MTRNARSLPSEGKFSTNSWPSTDKMPRRGPRVSLLTTRTHSLSYKHSGGESQ